MLDFFRLSTWRRAAPLGARTLLREWRAGQLKVLMGALVVAVASIVAVSAFTDRMDRGMQAGATELLAADLVVTSTNGISERLEVQAANLGLATARTLTTRSVAVAGEALQLSFLKAVGDGYPLRGGLRTSAQPYGQDEPTSGLPAPGEVWVEARLLALLNLEMGGTLELGATGFKVARVLTFEPDRGGDLFNIAPRVIMRLDELAATGLVQPASRVRHRLLVAGDEASVAQYAAWLESNLAEGEEIQGVRDARPEMRAALDRADSFLGLAAMVSVLLAGVAVALAARRHAQHHLDTAAMLRCLGLPRSAVTQVFITELAILGIVASLIGCVLGYLAQFGLSQALGTMLVEELPTAGLMPAVHGLAMGLTCLVGFALPPLVSLGKVPPLRVLRRDVGGIGINGVLSYLLAAAILLAVVLAQARDAKIALYVAGGGLVTVAVLALVAWLAVSLMARFQVRLRANAAMGLGIANLTRHPGASVLQVIAFGLGLMVLLLLVVVRQDLLDAWVKNLPPGTPNFFLVNVQPAETDQLREFFERQQVAAGPLYPMIRGRLSAVNDGAVEPSDFREPRAQRLAERDFNLSWTAELPEGNTVVAGEYWPAAGADPNQVSVEQGLAQTLGLELGDRVQFMIAGSPVEGTITSLRQVHWDTFDVNFFVLFPPGALTDQPSTYISSFYIPEAQRPMLVDLVRAFPSVTAIDIDALLTKVRALMNQASRAVEFVFGFTLLAGLVVLFAAVQATLDQRRHEAAIIRTIGATRGRIQGALFAEFSLLGLLSGGLAAFAASAIGIALASKVFDLPYAPSAWIWLMGLAAGGLGVAAAGWFGTRAVMEQPPLVTLREG